MAMAGELCLRRKEADAALFFLNHALMVERNREGLYRLSMQAYALADRREEAIGIFADYRRYLAEELGLDPSAEMRHFYDELICGAHRTGRV
jgi:DNA-binding SARP family transcriptional activator